LAGEKKRETNNEESKKNRKKKERIKKRGIRVNTKKQRRILNGN
jgi:hypothetical protein